MFAFLNKFPEDFSGAQVACIYQFLDLDSVAEPSNSTGKADLRD
jgi:hypothetical protein